MLESMFETTYAKDNLFTQVACYWMNLKTCCNIHNIPPQHDYHIYLQFSPFTSIVVFTHRRTFHTWLNYFYKWSMETYFHLHGFIIFTPWLFFLSTFKIILMTWFKTSEAFHFALGWFVAQHYFHEQDVV